MSRLSSAAVFLCLTACSSPGAVTLSLTLVGEGSVQVGEAGSCTETCSHSFKRGSVVTLTATPPAAPPYWDFLRWAEQCQGQAECTVTMNDTRRVTAVFTGSPTNTMTVEVIGAGTVVSSPAGIECPAMCTSEFLVNDDVVLSPSASAPDEFKGWYASCASAELDPCTVSMNSNKTAQATFGAPGGMWWVAADGDYGSGFFDPLGDYVAVDTSGHAIALNFFQGTIDLDGDPLDDANGQFYLAKYDLAGNRAWHRQFGALGGGGRDVKIAVDANGDTVIAGEFPGTFSAGSLPSLGLVFMKVSAAGDVLWANTVGATITEDVWGLAVAPDATILLSVWCEGTIDFGAGAMACGTTSHLARYDGGGTFMGIVRTFPSNMDARALAVDVDGNIIIGGWLFGTANLGGGSLSGGAGTGGFVAKLDSGGTHLWSKDSGTPTGTAMVTAVQATGLDIAVAGELDSTLDWGGGALATAGGKDIFYAAFSAGGSEQAARTCGGSARDDSPRVAVSPTGDVTVSGGFTGSVDFGTGALVAAGDRTSLSPATRQMGRRSGVSDSVARASTR